MASGLNRMSRAKMIALLTGLYACWRLLTLAPIETGGDAITKWAFIRCWLETGIIYPALPNHHQARWAINLPVAGLQEIFGAHIWVYYIFPLLTGLAAGLLLYLIIAKYSTRATGFCAFLFFLLFPYTARECMQFLPLLPAMLFVLGAFLMLMAHLEGKLRSPWLYIAGLLVGAAYGCKETSLYWAFAFALFLSLYSPAGKTGFHIWKLQINRPALYFSFGVLTVLALEFFLLNSFFHITGGRVQMISGAHLDSITKQLQGMNLFAYLCSFVYPVFLKGKAVETVPFTMVMISGLIVGVLWLRDRNLLRKLMAFSFFTVFLLHSYMVYKIFPFRHPEKFHGRYFILLTIFAIMLTFAGWKELRELLRKKLSQKAVAAVAASFLGITFVLCLLCVGDAWRHGECVLNVARGIKMENALRQENIPVLVEYAGREITAAPVYDEQNVKNFIRWRTLLCPTEMLTRHKDAPALYTDGEYIYMAALNPEKISAGQETELFLLRDEGIQRRKKLLTLAPIQFAE